MSAAGVTEWYQKEEQEEEPKEDGLPERIKPPEEELFLGLYSFAFIQEFRQKVGALFFASRRDRTRQVDYYIGKAMIGSTEGTCTMMPFYWGNTTGRWRPRDAEDHPATAS